MKRATIQNRGWLRLSTGKVLNRGVPTEVTEAEAKELQAGAERWRFELSDAPGPRAKTEKE